MAKIAAERTVLTQNQIDALPYEVTEAEVGYRTFVTHDTDHPNDAGDAASCGVCDRELAAIRAALPTGWSAQWTGDGNGDDLDVAITPDAVEGE